MSASVAAGDPGELQELREIAERAARAGGAVARAAFGRRHAVRYKLDRSEVTDVDLACERAVADVIRAARPRDFVLSEEQAAWRAPDEADACWVVDPLDGTRNFVRAIPHFACSVAVMRAGAPVVGAVFDPLRDELYSADAVSGAALNGAPLRLAAPPPPAAADEPHGKLLVAIPSTRHARAHAVVLRWLDELVVRNFGAAALHLAMVAAGQLDAALLTNSRLWDVAAGAILVTAAGGVITTPEGDPLFPLDVRRYDGEELPALAAPADRHARLTGRR